jgi:hypothetical protein
MQLPTVELEPHAARKAFLEYRTAVRERRGRVRSEPERRALLEDQAIMRAYKAAASGARIIDLPKAIRLGGIVELELGYRRWHPKTDTRAGYSESYTRVVQLPRVAVARADTSWIWSRGIAADGSFELRSQRNPHHRNQRDRMIFQPDTFPTAEARHVDWDSGWRPRAMVPTIPPPLRPEHHLSGYHILFEAEWHVDTTSPPVDPALLKHLGGDLYAVIAAWDLTPVEQAVLAGRQVTEADLGAGW